MKKIFALILLIMIALAFTGCAKESPKTSDNNISEVAQNINESVVVTSPDDSSIHKNLGAGNKSMMDW